tara:strand:- start:131 stop:1099 length:969 start_codon:yes stop_codon:yes gene_type:complete
MTSKIFITGSTGFVGRYLTKLLIQKGYELVCLTRGRSQKTSRKMTTLTAKEEDFISKEFLMNAVNNCDAVIHLAGIADNNYIKNQEDKNELDKINKIFPVTLYQVARKCAIKKFIFMSTIKVNGEYTKDVPFMEESPLDVTNRNKYVKSKIDAENELINNFIENDHELLSIIRPPLIYGEGIKGNIKTLIKIIKKGFPLPTTQLNNKRSMISIYNLSDLILRILESQVSGLVRSCCKDTDITTKDLVRKIGFFLDKSKPDFYFPKNLLKVGGVIFKKTDMINKLTEPLIVDDTKTREIFNWKPCVDFDTGMNKTINSFVNAK